MYLPRAQYREDTVIGYEQNVSTAENYRRFSRLEARGRSALYEQISASVADDVEVLAFLAALPPAKRQPNLLLAAVRFLTGVQDSYRAFRTVLLDRRTEVAAVMLSRSTQTNEPARCAVLLPALARLAPPLALIEVGASAGLTLLPDLYGYDYAGQRIEPADPAAPVLTCRPRGPVPIPAAVPEVAWRAGIDLNPLDVTDPDDMAWLSSLIWPGEGQAGAAVGRGRRGPPPQTAGRRGRPDRGAARAGRPGTRRSDAGDLPHLGALLRRARPAGHVRWPGGRARRGLAVQREPWRAALATG